MYQSIQTHFLSAMITPRNIQVKKSNHKCKLYVLIALYNESAG